MPLPGKVFLVGAGPGDPGLITLRGLECLARADLVLYDGLVNPLILRHTSATAERTCRSPAVSGRRLDQQEINERLIAAALEGKTVVRLKGGDPFVFGRGGEEAAALAARGIPFEVVPGVTAAVAASAYAGFSITHRDCASAVAFVTGHEDPQKPGISLDYHVLAAFPGTLVFYMGLHRLPAIVAALLAAGKPPTVPAAVISRGTTPFQRTISATLGDLANCVQQADLHAPSMIIIGDCVRQRESTSWFERRPLLGQRVAITRPDGQVEPLIARLVELGAQPILTPVISIRPPDDWGEVDRLLPRLGDYDWLVFTSANGVRSLLGRLWETGGDCRRLHHCRLAAIGEGTAQTLGEFHLRADLVPVEFRAEALAELLRPHVAGQRMLWARANRGRDILPRELAAAGARLDQVIVYQNDDLPAWPAETTGQFDRGEIDWLCLSSPSIARNAARLIGDSVRARLGARLKIATISPVTSTAAREAGLPVTVEAAVYTWNGLIDAIIAHEASPAGG